MEPGPAYRLSTCLPPETAPMKTYIGDSVYVSIETPFASSPIVLTTENGFGPSNTIVLEPEVWASLTNWVNHYRGAKQ
jgi:hypothetical protein